MFDTTNYADKIPPAVLDGLISWGKKERPVGGFLTTFLSDKLMESIARADESSLAAFRYMMLFVHNEMPSQCHGSPAKVKAWEEEIYKELCRKEEENGCNV